MNIVKIALTTLAAPLGSSDMAYTLTNLVDSQGNPVSLSDFGTWFVTVIKSGDLTEIIYNTNLVQNDDGSVTVTIGANGRDILPKPPYTGVSEGRDDFPAGADVIVTNDPYTMSRFVQLDNTNIFTVTPQTSAGDPTLPTELTRKAYVDALVLGTLTTLDVIVPGIAGETVAAGQGLYLDEATGRWKLWDADTVFTVDNVLLGIAQGAGTVGLAIASGVLLQGVDTHQTGMSTGTVMYAGNTPGQITAVPGTEVVTVGIAKDATNLYFAPRFNMQLTKTGNDFLMAVTGMSFMWNDTLAPTGFLLEDGSLYANNSYAALVAFLKGREGVDTGTTFTANAGTDVITAATHGLSAGQILLLDSTTTLPGGLSPNTIYYVINPTTNTFQLATSAGGSAVNITDTGTGTHSYHTQFKVPDSRGRVIVGTGTGVKVGTFVSRASNVVTLSGLTNANNNEFQTGQAVVYSAPGGAMTGLTSGSTYYLIRLSNTTYSLASSLANAQNGTAIALSSDGTGAQTFTLTLSARALGDTGGEETHAMSIGELLAHTHPADETANGSSGGLAYSRSTGSAQPIAAPVNSGNQAMNNMQPFGTKTFIIKT